jgi:hypothetical protein
LTQASLGFVNSRNYFINWIWDKGDLGVSTLSPRDPLYPPKTALAYVLEPAGVYLFERFVGVHPLLGYS